MNTYETNIIRLFLKYKNEKNFIEKVRKTLSKEIGFKLFTLTVMHPKKKIVTRIYSSNKKIYPVGGEKRIPKNYFTHITIKEKKSFIGNNKKQIKKYFYDHKVITDLGCESILNQVIVFNNKTIGTMNLLNIKGHFNKEHLKKTNYISKFLVPVYLNHQLKAR